MDLNEWSSLSEVYEEYDASGNVTTTSVVEECVEEDWGYITVAACTFLVGYIPDWEALGFSSPWQRTAGWLNGPGDYGIRNWSFEWEYVGHLIP